LRCLLDLVPADVAELLPPEVRDHLAHAVPGRCIRVRKFGRPRLMVVVRRTYYALLDEGARPGQAVAITADHYCITERHVRRLLYRPQKVTQT